MPRINVAITGSSASLERAFAQASASAKAFNLEVAGTAVSLSRLEQPMAKLGRSLTRTITLPTVALGVVATKMGIDFNRQMLLIQTQAGASAGEVKKLSGEVLNLAKATPQGPTELAQGLYHLESIGLRGAKAMQTLRIAALAAGMGIASLEDVSTALGGVVVTGIEGAQNYQTAMATLTATVGAGNMRFEDLAGSIGNVAPAAAAAGVSLPELGAAMATLTDRGFSADEAATRLRVSLALIQSPSAKAKKALKDMGVNADELGATLRSPNGLLKVLQTLNAAIQRVGAVRGNRDLLAAFGGGRSGLGIQTLVQSLNQGLSSYQSKLVDVSAGEKKFAGNQKAYLESPAYKLASAWSSVQVSLVKLGATFAPIAVRIAQAVARIADGFSALPKFVKQGAGAIIAVFAIGGPILVGLAAVIRAMTTLRLALAALGPSAAASAAETEGALAGIGAAAAGARTKVGLLRGSLIALAAIPIGQMVTAQMQQLSGWLGKHVGHGVGDTPLPPGVSFNQFAEAIKHAKSGTLTTRDRQILVAMGAPASALPHALPGTGNTTSTREQNPRRGVPGSPSNGPVPGTTPKVTPSEPGYAPSKLAQLNLALAKNPNSVEAIQAKLAYDRSAAAFAEKRIAAGRGSKSLVAQLQGVYGDINTLTAQLAALEKKSATAKTATKKIKVPQFVLPFALQLGELKAQTTKTTADDRRIAQAEKQFAQKMIRSGKLRGQALLDAWREIIDANSRLAGDQTRTAIKNYHFASLASLTRGITSPSVRKEVEARIAQAQAHSGAIYVKEVHVHGVHDVKKLKNELAREARKGATQTRGHNAGSYSGIH